LEKIYRVNRLRLSQSNLLVNDVSLHYTKLLFLIVPLSTKIPNIPTDLVWLLT